MESKTKIPFRYIAGGCFAASAIIYFINNCLHYNVFKYNLNNLNYISLVLAFAVIAVGLFLSVPMVSAAGSNLFLINQAVQLYLTIPVLSYVLSYHPNSNDFMLFIQVLVLTIFALLLLITCLNRRSAKITGIIAAVIRFVLAICIVFSFGGSLLEIIMQPLLECAGAVFLGFAFSELKDKPKTIVAATPKAPGVTDTYEKLTHLKGLLDKGIITQEDFDAKKKDFLGS